MRQLILSLILICCSQVQAAGAEWLQLEQLYNMVKTMNDQLDKLEEATDLQKQLRDMESLKVVKEVSDGGSTLLKIGYEVDETNRIINSFESPSEQFQQLRNDLNAYSDEYSRASNEDDALEALKKYGKALSHLEDQYWAGTASEAQSKAITNQKQKLASQIADLERLSTLRESQSENQASLIEGVNEKDAAITTATDVNSLLDIVISNREDEIEQAAHQNAIDMEQMEIYNQITGTLSSTGE